MDKDSNSQRMMLLRPSLGATAPKAIGGPNTPHISETLLHPHFGSNFEALDVEIEQDENGIGLYIVQEGDTLSEIAQKFAVSENTIVWENNLGNTLSIGDELRILPLTGIRHTIASGDTLSEIAEKYEVNIEDVATFNDFADDSKLVVGEKIIVPNGVKPTVQRSVRSGSTASYVAPLRSNTSGYYIRPTGAVITSRFGPRSLGYHYGMDFGGPIGTPIVAAASGTVIQTSCGSGYGICLKLQHNNGTQTLYAHNNKLLVSTGTKVQQGQKIAEMGNTGRSTGPHLHFEIIKANGQKLDPAPYIGF